MLLATLLDPSTKDLVDLDQYSKSELLVDAVVVNKVAMAKFRSQPRLSVSNIWNRMIPGEADNDSKPVSKRRRLLMKHRLDVTEDDGIGSEVNSYLQVKVADDVDDDPLIFWKNVQELENLKQLAAVILTRSASSVDVECMFSTMGLILNGKLSRLNAQSADALCFVHDNIKLL